MSRAINRRTVLRGLGMGLASAIVPTRFAFAADPISPVMTALSNYMTAARSRALPADVVEKAKDHILDTFAAMLSGSKLSPGRVAFSFAADFSTDTTATVVASRLTAS